MVAVTRHGLQQSINFGLNSSSASDALHACKVPAAMKKGTFDAGAVFPAAIFTRAAIAAAKIIHTVVAAAGAAGSCPIARGAVSGAGKPVTRVFR